jgi:hypothetical protein
MSGISKTALIDAANGVISQYSGMKLTIRQIYYRLVAGQVMPNLVSSYKKLVNALTFARRDGSVDYEAIEDRTRAVHQPTSEQQTEGAAEYFNGYYEYLKGLDTNYRMPKWWGQEKKVQVWVEKQALASLFQSVTDRWGVDLVVCRGYPSLTLLYEASNILNDEDTKDLQILYFGDFDPSGADIERAVGESLDKDFDVDMEINRVAITRDQITKYHIPPAPAKRSDSRYQAFVETEGVAWQVELDAIEPKTLQEMIDKAIGRHFDQDQKKQRDQELERRKDKIRGYLEDCFNPDFEPPRNDDDETP